MPRGDGERGTGGRGFESWNFGAGVLWVYIISSFLESCGDSNEMDVCSSLPSCVDGYLCVVTLKSPEKVRPAARKAFQLLSLPSLLS